MKKVLLSLAVGVLVAIGLMSVIKGVPGAVWKFQQGYDTSVGSPFESSGSTARYVLVQAIIEDKRFDLTEEKAHVSSPDIALFEGKYLTIFAPGVSFLGLPLYLLGRTIGLPQFMTYLLNPLVSLINVFLIALLARRLGAGTLASYLGGLIYLFATNALTYALTFTQHQIAACIITSAILVALSKKRALSDFFVGFLFATGVMMDIPNIFLLTPVVLFALSQHIKVQTEKSVYSVRLNFIALVMLLGTLLPLGLFAYYNHALTGSYLSAPQFLGRHVIGGEKSNVIESTVEVAQPVQEEQNASSGFKIPFQTRAQLQSGYILLFSKQRAWWYYSPVILLGVVGIWIALKEKKTQTAGVLTLATVLINLTTYSLFWDPWGGWSFGARYLIPAAGLMGAFLAVAISRLSKNIFFSALFAVLLVYSVWVSTLGALTTAAIPPKGEAEALADPIPYTYEYNQDLLEENKTNSLLYYLVFANSLSAQQYHIFLTAVFSVVLFAMYLMTIELKLRLPGRQKK